MRRASLQLLFFTGLLALSSLSAFVPLGTSSINVRIQAPLASRMLINGEPSETPPRLWKRIRPIPIISSFDRKATEMEVLGAIQLRNIKSDEPLYLCVRTPHNPKKVSLSATGAVTCAEERPLLYLRVRRELSQGQYVKVSEESQILLFIATKDKEGKAMGVQNWNVEIDAKVVSATDEPLPLGYKIDLEMVVEPEQPIAPERRVD